MGEIIFRCDYILEKAPMRLPSNYLLCEYKKDNLLLDNAVI